MYDEPDPEPPRPRLSGRAPAIAGLVLLILSLGSFALFLGTLDRGPIGGESVLPPPASRAPSAAPSSARFAEAGTCLINAGSEADPSLEVVECQPGTLEVLQRVDGVTDVTTCQSVDGYRYHYFFDSELAGLDFVLCMGVRP